MKTLIGGTTMRPTEGRGDRKIIIDNITPRKKEDKV